MEIFHYNDAGYVLIGERLCLLSNLSKKTKTRTITEDGWSTKINTKDIRISPTTYWRISGNYDQQFEGRDASCYLCGWYGMDYAKSCKCESHFSVEEHKDNVLKARRNYLMRIIDSYFPEYSDKISKYDDKQIDSVLYGVGKYGEHIIRIYYPVWNWEIKGHDTRDMKKHLDKITGHERTISII